MVNQVSRYAAKTACVRLCPDVWIAKDQVVAVLGVKLRKVSLLIKQLRSSERLIDVLPGRGTAKSLVLLCNGTAYLSIYEPTTLASQLAEGD